MGSLAALFRALDRALPAHGVAGRSAGLVYHSLPSLGFQHFYLYDDGSTDVMKLAVQPYVRRGLVTLLANFTGSAAYLALYGAAVGQGSKAPPFSRLFGGRFEG